MLREGISMIADARFAVLALGLFFVTFVGIVLRTYRRSAREHYDEISRLPLDEGETK